MSIRRVVLVGLMAVGKSSVGEPLAERLGWAYVDVDERIQATTGQTVKQIDETEGEGAHRPIEDRIALEALADPDPSVLGLPAGSIERVEVRDALAEPDVFVIWLKADPLSLADKVERSAHRPTLHPDARTVLQQMADARYPLYGSLADVTIDRDVTSKSAAVHQAVEAVTSVW